MHYHSTITLLSAVALSGVSAQSTTTTNATVVTNNPAGAIYTATLPDTPFFKDAYPSGGNVMGSISAVSSPDGTGVMYKVQFSNLPTEGGPFIYHLHDAPVPADGNCTKTLAHLDPFQRGEATPCDATAPETCQVGDLSGKYGKVTADPFSATFTDDFSSTLSGLGSFFGNRSFVIHYANKTRISCANFALVSAGSDTCTGAASGSPTATANASFSTTPTGKPTSSASATGSPNSTVTTHPSPTATVVTTAGGSVNLPSALFLSGAFAIFAFLL